MDIKSICQAMDLTVVALLAGGAIAREMSIAAAGVALLVTTAASATSEGTAATREAAIARVSALTRVAFIAAGRTVASDVARLAALVAVAATAGEATAGSAAAANGATGLLGTVASVVALLTAVVAGSASRTISGSTSIQSSSRTVTLDMALLAAAIASRLTAIRALLGEMTLLVACNLISQLDSNEALEDLLG
jgi:hypothetical protein